jgi:hypothetical protein
VQNGTQIEAVVFLLPRTYGEYTTPKLIRTEKYGQACKYSLYDVIRGTLPSYIFQRRERCGTNVLRRFSTKYCIPGTHVPKKIKPLGVGRYRFYTSKCDIKKLSVRGFVVVVVALHSTRPPSSEKVHVCFM